MFTHVEPIHTLDVLTADGWVRLNLSETHIRAIRDELAATLRLQEGRPQWAKHGENGSVL